MVCQFAVAGAVADNMYCGNRECYEVLGLSRDANPSFREIRRAYRRLSLQWHPDKHVGQDERRATAMITQINNAYLHPLLLEGSSFPKCNCDHVLFAFFPKGMHPLLI